MINVRDRPTELSMLLESLYYQSYQDFDIYILDDASGTALNSYHFFNCMLNRLRCSNHNVFLKRTEFPHGVSKARQTIVDWALEKDYKYLCRVDDDVVLEADFLERLVNVINQGYDIASGVTPPMTGPTFIREPRMKVINQVMLDEKGNHLANMDDCGMQYTDDVILPTHHFRSSALYKSEIHKKVNYLPTKLTLHGFREEQIFSYKCLLAGFKIGVDTGAIAWHQLTPSGGERFPTQQEDIKFNQKIFEEFTRENKDKLNEIFNKANKLDKLELMKETNLLMK